VKHQWGELVTGAIFAALTIFFVLTGEIHWRGGGYTRRSEHPVLFYLVIAGVGWLAIYLLAEGLEKHGYLP
jgi:hypothetical protein